MMQRRTLLGLAGVAALEACVPRPRSAPRGVQAVAFDMLALFDPTTVDRRVATVLADRPDFATAWKTRLFEDSWLRAAAGRYVAFDRLVGDALASTARRARIDLSDSDRAHLAAVFTELDTWPDTHATLQELRARGLRLATLANFSPRMTDALLARSSLTELFDARISTDEARTYKPDPRAYALGENRLALPRAEIAFAAFGGWDAAGARWFGFPTFQVDRLGTGEVVADVASGPDLHALAGWLARGAP
jgi:2-haloacid dehalogenase